MRAMVRAQKNDLHLLPLEVRPLLLDSDSLDSTRHGLDSLDSARLCVASSQLHLESLAS